MERISIKYKGKIVEVMGNYIEATKGDNLTAPTQSEFHIFSVYYQNTNIFPFTNDDETIEKLVLEEIEN